MATTSVSLRQYPEQFLGCRDLQHPFAIVGYYRTENGDTKRRLQCSRCKSIGHDTLTPLGLRRKGRSYQYVEGYLIEGGLKPAQARQEQVRRATVYRTEEDMLATLTGSQRPRKSTYKVKHQPAKKKVGAKR